MVKPTKTFLLLGLCLALGLSGCGLNKSAKPTAQSAEALFTAAAKTAEAMRLQRFGLTPSPLDPQQMLATAAAITPTAIPLGPSTPITAATPVPASPAAPAAAPLSDKADYVADVSVPDGTSFAPGEAFQKTWKISNTGATTWTTAYQLVYVDGNPLGSEKSVALAEEVAPGKQVEVTVNMTAPSAPGSYSSFWKLRNAAGQTFGFGSDGKAAVWVKISVGGEAVPTGATPESAASLTPNAGEAAVASVGLEVDNASVTGACPHVFLVTAIIELNQAATVTYSLDIDGTGATVRTPAPATRNLPAGTHTVVFELSVPADFNGWVRLHLTQPGRITSDKIPISLTCG